MENKKSLKTCRHLDLIMPAVIKCRFLITIFLLAAIFVGGASAATFYADTTVNFTTNLSVAPAGSTIIIAGDFEVLDVTINKMITIQSDGTSRTLMASTNHRLFSITDAGNLILGDGVTLTGGFVDTGGAVYVNGGNFTMTGGTITNNTADYRGGGVYVSSGTFTMTGGTITKNTAGHFGGGVKVEDRATFNMTGGTITDNIASEDGGGVCVSGGNFTMNNGTITNNTADYHGGGVYMSGGNFTMNNGTITSNTADRFGGGVYVSGGNFTMDGGTITDNTADSCGGVYVINSGTFTMNNGTITDNTADSCGGVFVSSGTFNMNGGNITSNTAANSGGGVYVFTGTFTMNNGTITDNTADYGGGVYMHSKICTFNMNGGNITSNTAANSGSGMYMNMGTFTINGSATVDTNNDVYLRLNGVDNITVAGFLTENAGAHNITLGYSSGIVISYNDGVLPGTWTNNFALNPTWAKDCKLDLKQSGNNIIVERNCLIQFLNDTTLLETQNKFIGEFLIEPATPIWNHHTFNGWYTTTESRTPWNFETTKVEGDTDLYANWTADITSLNVTGLVAPVLGATPKTTVTVSEGGIPLSVSWYPSVSTFAENTQYKAIITIQNASGYVFNTTEPSVSLNGDALSSSDVTLNTATQLLTISHTFPATEAKVLPTITLSANVTSGTIPLPVKFTYSVTNSTSTLWTYGDDSYSTLSLLGGTLNHTYTTAGTYSASLKATNANGTVYQNISITVKKVGLVAGFQVSALSGTTPLTVRFTDTSVGTITSRIWNFADGTSDNVANPTHTFTAPGSYKVFLTISDGVDSDSTYKTIVVNSSTGFADEISLISGWNFISVPKTLNNTIKQAKFLFADVDTDGRGVLVYESHENAWFTLNKSDIIQPLNGYWVYSVTPRTIALSYPADPGIPSVKTLYPGWNAIGLSSLDNTPAQSALTGTFWRVLIPWNLEGKQYDQAIINGSSDAHSPSRIMTLGNGYWLYVDAESKLVGLTA